MTDPTPNMLMAGAEALTRLTFGSNLSAAAKAVYGAMEGQRVADLPKPLAPAPFAPTALGSAPDLTGYTTVFEDSFETLDNWATYGASVAPMLLAGMTVAEIDADQKRMIGHRAPKNSGPYAIYTDDAVGIGPEGLLLTARRLPKPIGDRTYHTGRVWLKDEAGQPRAFKYFYAKARIKLDIRNGAHVAYWFQTLLPWGGPGGGEIDVMERLGHWGKSKGREDQYHTALHVEGSSDPDPNRTIKATIGEGWHDFEVVWNADRIDFFLDGKCVRSVANPGLHEPQYPILNLAVASDWAMMKKQGATGQLAASDFPMTMTVDHVLIMQAA